MKKSISMLICGLLVATSVASATSVTALAAPKINPYKTVQAETNFGSEGVEKTPEVYNDKKITVLNSVEAGDYWIVKDVDFSEGLSKISLTARADEASLIEVRKDSVDGETLGNIKINTTNGEFKTFTGKMKNLEGKSTIVFVGVIGNASADYWVAEKAATTVVTPDPEPVVTEEVDPYVKVEAENAVSRKFAAELTDGDTTYLAIRADGGYAVAKNVNFYQGVAALQITAKANKAAVLELRLDSYDGEVLASYKINPSESFVPNYVKVSENITGIHDVYYVATVSGTTVQFDSWTAIIAPLKPNPDEPDPDDPIVTDKVNPYVTVEAEDATEMEGLEVKTDGNRTYVERLRPRVTYIVKNVEFDGSEKIAITYKSDSAHVLEIHDGAKNGPRLAFLNIPNSDYEWATIYLDFPDLHGVYDLYFVPKFGVIDFDSWSILKSGDEPNPVDPDDPIIDDPDDPIIDDPDDPIIIDPDPVEKGITTEYTLNDWGSGYQVLVKVNNESTKRVEGWTVKVNKEDVGIDASWNVNVKEEAGYYVITPVEWNKAIEAGKSVEFGFQGSSHVNSKIELFAVGEVKDDPVVNPDPVDPDDPIIVDPDDPIIDDPDDPIIVEPDDPIVVNDDLDLEYTISGQGSCTINFKVANNGKTAVNSWTLKLKKSQITIDNFWCAKVSVVGDYYVITPESWNSVINAGDGAYFGIQGSGVTSATLDYTLE